MEWSEVLGKWQTLKKEITGVLVVQDNPTKSAQLSAKFPNSVPIVPDEDGQIANKLNAVFLPRAYGFEDGRLVWLQETPNVGIVEILTSFLTKVKGKKKAESIINAWSLEMREKAWGKIQISHERRKR